MKRAATVGVLAVAVIVLAGLAPAQASDGSSRQSPHPMQRMRRRRPSGRSICRSKGA